VQIASESPQDALNIPEAIYRSYLEPLIAELGQINTRQQTEAARLQARIDRRIGWLMWLILLPLSLRLLPPLPWPRRTLLPLRPLLR
jgi:methyl-accepting chemotaxis protein